MELIVEKGIPMPGIGKVNNPISQLAKGVVVVLNEEGDSVEVEVISKDNGKFRVLLYRHGGRVGKFFKTKTTGDKVRIWLEKKV